MNIEAYFKITYGIYVVSSVANNKLNGFIANTVFQVTADPPRFAVACSKENYTTGMILNSQLFGISVLQKNTRPDLIGTFGYRSGKDLNKFEKYHYKTGQSGLPILLDDTLAWFECKVIQTIDLQSHLIFVGETTDGDLLVTDDEPLTYAYYRDVKKGKSPKNAPTFIDPSKFTK